MKERTNADRAKTGEEVINAYCQEQEEASPDFALICLLADLMHFAKAKNINFYECVADANQHYRTEQEGELNA